MYIVNRKPENMVAILKTQRVDSVLCSSSSLSNYEAEDPNADACDLQLSYDGRVLKELGRSQTGLFILTAALLLFLQPWNLCALVSSASVL
jgi:hypothetical protein